MFLRDFAGAFLSCGAAGAPVYWELRFCSQDASGTPNGRFSKPAMRFTLVDRIVELEVGVRIKALKNVSMAEEYLEDHFPGFPVMPGVLMLESMTQAAAWLIRAGEDFAHSIIVLGEARNVKYGNFVEPGQVLTVEAEIQNQDERRTTVKARGHVDGEPTVAARLTLERYNLSDHDPSKADADAVIVQRLREHFAQLYREEPASNRSPADA